MHQKVKVSGVASKQTIKIAQVTTALDAGQRAAEAELALNMAGWDR
jgi:hypothetical protein